MTRIICAEDYGNAPKRLLIRDWLTALARGNNAFVLKHLSEDVVWQRVGSAPLVGKLAVAAELQKMKREIKTEMTIENILSHGAAGAADGVMRLKSGRTFGFAHVYRFQGAAGVGFKEITEYLIRTGD